MMKKKYLLISLLSIALLALTGCQSVENWFKNAKEEWLGLEMTVRTYDENSQLIDQMSGKPKSLLFGVVGLQCGLRIYRRMTWESWPKRVIASYFK